MCVCIFVSINFRFVSFGIVRLVIFPGIGVNSSGSTLGHPHLTSKTKRSLQMSSEWNRKINHRRVVYVYNLNRIRFRWKIDENNVYVFFSFTQRRITWITSSRWDVCFAIDGKAVGSHWIYCKWVLAEYAQHSTIHMNRREKYYTTPTHDWTFEVA